jgi:hypothetical protein
MLFPQSHNRCNFTDGTHFNETNMVPPFLKCPYESGNVKSEKGWVSSNQEAAVNSTQSLRREQEEKEKDY